MAWVHRNSTIIIPEQIINHDLCRFVVSLLDTTENDLTGFSLSDSADGFEILGFQSETFRAAGHVFDRKAEVGIIF